MTLIAPAHPVLNRAGIFDSPLLRHDQPQPLCETTNVTPDMPVFRDLFSLWTWPSPLPVRLTWLKRRVLSPHGGADNNLGSTLHPAYSNHVCRMNPGSNRCLI